MRMTLEEYEEKMAEASKDMHPELASVLRMMAYERGHHAGYEEVYCIFSNMANNFETINELLMKGAARD